MSEKRSKQRSIRFPLDLVQAISDYKAGHPAWDSLRFSGKVIAMLWELIGLRAKEAKPEEKKEETLADLLARADLSVVSRETDISEERLVQLRSGDRPTELEAIDLAHHLEVDTSSIYIPPHDQEASQAHEHHC